MSSGYEDTNAGSTSMQSKNKKSMTAAERKHVNRLSDMPCSVCGSGPVEVHEIKQGQWFTAIPLCYSCHRSQSGWHGNKTAWNVRKMNELDALAVTIEGLMT
jgi:hypothetical protein